MKRTALAAAALRSTERGAIVIQMAVGMVAFLGLGAFAVDYGVLVVSRAQAQNAADAGAMAGALARAYDGDDDVEEISTALVQQNQVWFAEATSSVFLIDGLAECPPGAKCVRVEVRRDDIPTIFGPVLGIATQDVRAMATAQVAVGHGTRCLRPLAIPDAWIDLVSNTFFDRFDASGGLLVNTDGYTPPGMTIMADLGVSLTLDLTLPDSVNPLEIGRGLLLPTVLDGVSTPSEYVDNIVGCIDVLATIGEFLPIGTDPMQELTDDAIQDLIDADLGASWNSAISNVDGSCAPACAPISPRLVPVAVFDVAQYQLGKLLGVWPLCPGLQPCVRVVNIVGLFLESPTVARLARYPGELLDTVAPVTPEQSFLPTVALVR